MPAVHLESGFLIRREEDQSELLLGPWDGAFRTWRRDNDASPEAETYPTWPLLDEADALQPGRGYRYSRREWQEHLANLAAYQDAPLDPQEWPSWDDVEPWAARSEAWQQYRDAVPLEARALAKPFGRFQWAVREGLKYIPELWARIGRWPGYVYACLLHAEPLSAVQAERLHLLAEIAVDDRPRPFMGRASLSDYADVLTKFPIREITRRLCGHLIGASHDHAVWRFIQQAPKLTVEDLNFLVTVPAGCLTSLTDRNVGHVRSCFNETRRLMMFDYRYLPPQLFRDCVDVMVRCDNEVAFLLGFIGPPSCPA